MELVKPRRAIFIGFMGAGKYDVGLASADRLGLDHYDMDQVFEERFGAIEGYLPERESEFRGIESDILRELLAIRNVVISAGGGSLLRDTNRELARSMSTVIWLRVDFEVAVERAKNDKKKIKRPFLAEDIVKLRQRFDARQAIYEASAHVIVDANGPIEEVVVDALGRLKQAWAS